MLPRTLLLYGGFNNLIGWTWLGAWLFQQDFVLISLVNHSGQLTWFTCSPHQQILIEHLLGTRQYKLLVASSF